MVAVTFSSLSLEIGQDSSNQHGVVTEEINGLIKVYKDGNVERTKVVPCVPTALAPELGVTSQDIVIDKFTNIWARFYVPAATCYGEVPLIVYFHGGGFCVGSAAWSCYHEFLARLASNTNCIIMSVNYRLAPENPLPAAYEDGIKALIWLKHQAISGFSDYCWLTRCNFNKLLIGGDSAGANIAYNVVIRLNEAVVKPLIVKGIILIQPFFGGETRTYSEKCSAQSPRSTLSLSASDKYWRLALPCGSNRDHPWCNPLAKGAVKTLEELKLPIMVCISEMDILKDRNLEFVGALCRTGNKRVERVVHKGVGHAFQVLSKSQLSQTRTLEMVSQIKDFIDRAQ